MLGVAQAQDYGAGAPHVGGINWSGGAAAPPDGVASSSYVANCIALYRFEEADNATALADDSSSCGAAGTDCDLSDNNTVPRNAVAYVEGAKSADYESGSSEYHDCVGATCDELRINNNVTVMAWVQTEQDPSIAIVDNLDGNYGYSLGRDGGGNTLSCTIGDGTDTQTQNATNQLLPSADAGFVHTACRFIDADNEIVPFINGAANGCTPGSDCQAQEDLAAPSAGNFIIQHDGEVDEVCVINDGLTAAEVCKACSCQIDGTLCMCDGSTPADYKACTVDNDCRVEGNTTALCNDSLCIGRNSTETPNCGSCTMASCNATL